MGKAILVEAKSKIKISENCYDLHHINWFKLSDAKCLYINQKSSCVRKRLKTKL